MAQHLAIAIPICVVCFLERWKNYYDVAPECRECTHAWFVNLLCTPLFHVLCSSVQNSERGKKIGNAMITTSRNMVQTGKVVGKKAQKSTLKFKQN